MYPPIINPIKIKNSINASGFSLNLFITGFSFNPAKVFPNKAEIYPNPAVMPKG